MASQVVLVTGVSSGIGAATVRALLAQGTRVIGAVRKAVDAEELESVGHGKFATLVMDLASPESIERARLALTQELKVDRLDALINNAGVAHPGPIAEQPLLEVRRMFEINFFGLVQLTRGCLPLLGMGSTPSSAPGRIINVSSGAGKMAIPYLAGYVASKHALEGFSNSLRRELLPWKIPVVVVGPGNVKTPIWDKAGSDEAYAASRFGAVYKNFLRAMRDGEKKGMEAEEIAHLMLKIVNASSPKTRYEPVAQKFTNWTLPRLLPDKTLDRMLFSAFGMADMFNGPKQLPAKQQRSD